MSVAHDPSIEPAPGPAESVWREFARAPLAPIAVAVSAGLIADRYASISAVAAGIVSLVGIILWMTAHVKRARAAPVWLWVAAGGLAAAYHHVHLHSHAPDNIAGFAREQPAPVRVRGTLTDEPVLYHPPAPNPLVTEQHQGPTSRTVLELTQIESRGGWIAASGRARLTVEGRLDGLHAADRVEVFGRLSKPAAPGNPGERDLRTQLRDQRITATIRVEKSAATVTLLEDGWRTSLFGWLGVVRGWGTRAFRDLLPPGESGLAAALLLGETSALDREEWDAYVRTGVVHVLAISGQHLVILAAFVWLILKVLGVRRRHGAWVVIGVMVVYALLTGARPSAVRAAVMVCALCGAIVLRRPAKPANAFALAWLIVIGVNPADAFSPGCQLSFLSVFVLVWGAARWLSPRPRTPVEQLVDETRTGSERFLRAFARFVYVLFAVSLILGVANAPLILAWQNLVSPMGIVLGPPLIVLTSVALIFGFLLLLASPLGAWAAWPFARVTEWSLAGCERLVHGAEQVPGGWVYAPAPSLVWLVGFYVGVAALVLLPGNKARWAFHGLALWIIVGIAVSYRSRATDELRMTFLAVGHGGCVVMEVPDGRVVLYDAGTTAGPDAVRRVIAPYLWSRGISRIDEVFLSHADLDHFNGMPELLKRFPVGRITVTPSFADKTTPGVEAVLTEFDRRGIARRVAVVAERLEIGDVCLDVLHPPVEGPPGNENVRSLVMLVRYAAHTVLLTGDLEGEGQELVRLRSIAPVDVMLAPHHGGKSANAVRPGPGGTRLPAAMASWARPNLVISSQRPGPTDHLAAAYGGVGATVWDTPTAGAVTVRCNATGVVAEAFKSGEVRVVTRGK